MKFSTFQVILGLQLASGFVKSMVAIRHQLKYMTSTMGERWCIYIYISCLSVEIKYTIYIHIIHVNCFFQDVVHSSLDKRLDWMQFSLPSLEASSLQPRFWRFASPCCDHDLLVALEGLGALKTTVKCFQVCSGIYLSSKKKKKIYIYKYICILM